MTLTLEIPDDLAPRPGTDGNARAEEPAGLRASGQAPSGRTEVNSL